MTVTTNIREEKNKIRQHYKKLRKEISYKDKKALDEAICRRLLSLCSYRYSDTVLLYHPLANEIDTTPIFLDAIKRKKKIAFPRCIEDNRMVFHYVESPEDLISGKYGIMEPSPTLPVYCGNSGKTICILPAIVYDKRGYRLGYGKGYYDRFLSAFTGTKVGLIYSDFIIDKIPNSKYDLRSDILVSNKGVISFAKN